MNFNLTDEQISIREMVREFTKEVIEPITNVST